MHRFSLFRTLISVLFLLLAGELAAQQEWQELKESDHRIKPQSPKDQNTDIQTALPEGHYEVGQGQIDGAFGLVFGEPIKGIHIAQDLGWRKPKYLPAEPSYEGKLKPFTVQTLKLSPPLQPGVLEQQQTQYMAVVDFNNHPITIETSVFNKAGDVINVIQRKYGEPDTQSTQQMSYQRGDLSLHIDLLDQDRARLRYQSLNTYQAYMKERNRALRTKFHRKTDAGLSPDELSIIHLARQIETYREDRGMAFGLPFGKRIGFRAKPDQYVPFEAPQPLSTFTDGNYHIMVSPDLIPIALRYELTGTDAELAKRKGDIEAALELAFAGFIKQTPNHSVLSFGPNAYSLIVRNGSFKFTIHDRAENKKRNSREKLAQVAKAEAERERLRQLEIARQKQAIAERQKQIKEEVAF